MKKLLFLALFMSVNFWISAQNNLKTLSDLLLELEGSVQWEAVDAEWETVRPNWLLLCQREYRTDAEKGATSFFSAPTRFQEAILMFEEHLKTSAMENPQWTHSYQSTWRSELGAIQSDEMLAKLLLQLEQNLTWKAVSTDWADRREAWIAACKAIVGTEEVNPNAEEDVMKFLGK